MLLNRAAVLKKILLMSTCLCMLPVVTVSAQEVSFEELEEAEFFAESGTSSIDEIVQVPLEPIVVAEEIVPEPIAQLEALQPEPEIVEAAIEEPQKKVIPHSGTYYDSSSIGPSALGAAAGPRKVDPLYEPGSVFINVQKNASASSRQASIVAAQRALKLGRNSAALELYEKLYKKNPRNTQVLMGLAVAQQRSGFVESAIATYEELLKRDSRHTGAMVNLMGILENRQPEVALKKLYKLWNKNQQNPNVAAQLGMVHAKIGNYEDANRYLGVAASLDPSNALHYYNLGIVSDQAKSHRTAIEYYQKALEVDIAHKGGGAIPREQVYDRLAQLRRL